MRRMISAALGLWFSLAGIGFAQSGAGNPVVVELYTSQGCSSCPPADRILSGLAQRDDVIALSLHVDYWDYIGWKDSFADPKYTKRQRAYARYAGARTIYTPQMIVGGMDHLVGVRPAEVDAMIRRFAAKPAKVMLTLGRTGGTVRVRARAGAPLPRGSVVQVVRYKPLETVAIRRGENAGKTFDYANIVTDWRQVGDWDGTADLSLDLDAPGGDPVVVIVQEPGPGPILAAAALR
ncbi:DUF1223 domain-containing protein [Defluviimonas sp. SAOS-178_SWC]|uniref:DUF1223 domain-containing protein n=1 Tax=Defluviimonas sp. SAOS-178_SWC TaxID=3121287 RepID=UPI0032219930